MPDNEGQVGSETKSLYPIGTADEQQVGLPDLGGDQNDSLASADDLIELLRSGSSWSQGINRFGEIGGVGACLHRHEVDQMLTSRSFAKVANHVRLDISCKYFAFRDALCNPHAEIPGARADISD